MIDKISRGWRIGGLLRYLMGPGRFNEHHDQRVIATWDHTPELHQPSRGSDGEFDIDDLIAELADPALAAGIPQREPPPAAGGKVPRGPVWHCSLRNHASDRILSDAEWADVVIELMDHTGIASRSDLGACRWVAVRHADDHVHVAAMLVRQDTGRRVHPRHDYNKARHVCRNAEQRLNLTSTAAADRTAIEPPTRGETEKAIRRGADETPRVWLRRAARVAAVQARDSEDYFRRLADLGVLYRPKESPPGQLVGYAVAAPGDLTTAGTFVWYSGARLGRDLTLPQLLKRWASAPPPAEPIPPSPTERSRVGRAERGTATTEAASAIENATAALAAGEDAEGPGIAHTTADMLTAVLTVTERLGHPRQRRSEREHWQPADVYARAAATPHIVQPTRLGPVATQLRTAAARLIAVRSLAGPREDQSAGAELLLAVAALIAEIAAYHERCHHPAQATAARRSAQLLPERAHSRLTQPPAAGAHRQTSLTTRRHPERSPAHSPAVRTSPIPSTVAPGPLYHTPQQRGRSR